MIILVLVLHQSIEKRSKLHRNAFHGRMFFVCVLQSILGVSYSMLACALWPLVALVVPEHQLGTAYGL